MKGISLAMFLLLAVRLILEPEAWKTFGFLMSSAPALLFFGYWLYLRRLGPQFIDWTGSHLIFKIGKERERNIPLQNIKRVEVKLDEIILHHNDGASTSINIESFQEYEDRLKIKENFQSIS